MSHRDLNAQLTPVTEYFTTDLGKMFLGDAIQVLKQLDSQSIDLIVTSPPYALLRKKDYGNAAEQDYLEWFRPFAEEFRRVLKSSGSLVVDIGGSWLPGTPTRSLYHFKLAIMLVEEIGLHLAQEFFWWNPSKLPAPAEWVNIRRIRVKDAVNTVWWLSKTPWPKANNRRVLQPYSPAMKTLFQNGYQAKRRPSGHDISNNFTKNNGAAIPPNLIAIPNTDSNSRYLRYCNEEEIKPHPARFPSELPEFFVRLLTDKGDMVLDPFAGSCVTAEVCETLRRQWLCSELEEEYLLGAIGRFGDDRPNASKGSPKNWYRISRPGVLWKATEDPEQLDQDGGRGYRQRRAIAKRKRSA